jgi:signal peptidase I
VSSPPKLELRAPRWLVRWVALPLVALVLLHACVLDAVRVQGASMAETLAPGDFLLVSKLASPARGDIVVFRLPENPALTLVKRVTRLPGEQVTLADGSTHVVAGESLFVEGDNRAPGASSDSREWGDLPLRDVVGVAVWRLFPVAVAGRLK